MMGFFDDLFGYDNPDLDRAIRRAGKLSKTGLSEEILEKMRRRLRLTSDRAQAGSRASTAARLRRRGVPVQLQEQILRDLSSSQLGELENSLLGVDVANENIKLDALKTYGDLAAQQPQGGFGLGQLLGVFGPGIISGGSSLISSLFGGKSRGRPVRGFSDPKFLPRVGP